MRYRLPPAFLAELEGEAADAPVVLGDGGSVLWRGRWLVDGIDAYSRQALEMGDNVLVRAPDDRVLLAARPYGGDGDGEETRLDDAVLIGGGPNFSHGLLDFFSRWMALSDAGGRPDPAYAGLPHLVAPDFNPGIRKLIQSLGLWPEQVVPLAGRPVRCRRLVVPSLRHRFQLIDPAWLSWLRARLGVGGLPPAGQRRRLYLRRRQTKFRRLREEEALVAALERLGVQPIVPEDHPIEEQLRIFGAAELVVTPLGGGVGAMAMVPSGAALVELTHARMDLPQYPVLTALAGQAYHQVIGTPLAPEDEAAGADDGNPDQINFNWDFSLPLDQVVSLVASVLQSRH